MRRFTVLAAVALLCLTAGNASAQVPAADKLSLTDLSLEVEALRLMHQFKLKPDQLQAVRKLAKETIQDPMARQAPKASEAFHKLLLQLREALIKADDDERILDLEDELTALRDEEEPEIDDGVEITEEAARRAPDVLRQLSAGQVAHFISLYGEEAPDPLQTLLDALDRVRGLEADEWKKLRQEVAQDVGLMVAGLNTDKATRIGDQAVQWLIRVRSLTEAEFKAQRGELEKEARQIIGEVGPFDVLRHLTEHAVAELLSNPRLEQALAARLK